MADLAKLVVKLEAQTAQYQKQLEGAEKRLSMFDRRTRQTASAVGKNLVRAATLAAGALATVVKMSLNTGDRLTKLGQQTGVATEALSKLEYAGDLAGVASTDLATSLARLTRTSSDAARGLSAPQRAFSALGVSVQEADGSMRATEDILLDVADKFSKIEDGAGKAALAQELFGRSGVKMIPFLNAGRKGMEEMGREAEKLGIVWTTEAGMAAEVFNDNISRIQKAMGGLVQQATMRLLPTLSVLSERMVYAAKNSEVLNGAITVLTVSFKAFLTVGAVINAALKSIGRVLGATAAAVVMMAKGEFKNAATTIRSAFRDASESAIDDIELMVQIWTGKLPELEASAKKTDDALRETLIFGNETEENAAVKKVESAIESLRRMEEQLRTQIATFGQGEAEIIKYRLAHGDLAEAVRLAGAAGEEFANTIVAQTEALAELNAEAEWSEQRQRDWNTMLEEGVRIAEAVRTPLEVYQDEVERLNTLLELGVIQQETYNRAVEQAQDAFDKAVKGQNKFLDEASRNVQGIISDALVNGFEDGARGMLKTFVDMLLKMQAEALAARIAEHIFGGGGVGSGGGIVGAIGGALGFGGSRDSGGRGEQNKAYLIGTGAQPEMFVPDAPGTFTPMKDMMPNVSVNPQIINVRDPSEIPTAIQSAQGEQAIINVLTRNQSVLRNLLQR